MLAWLACLEHSRLSTWKVPRLQVQHHIFCLCQHWPPFNQDKGMKNLPPALESLDVSMTKVGNAGIALLSKNLRCLCLGTKTKVTLQQQQQQPSSSLYQQYDRWQRMDCREINTSSTAWFDNNCKQLSPRRKGGSASHPAGLCTSIFLCFCQRKVNLLYSYSAEISHHQMQPLFINKLHLPAIATLLDSYANKGQTFPFGTVCRR